jgi:hypothetical protein
MPVSTLISSSRQLLPCTTLRIDDIDYAICIIRSTTNWHI